LAEREGGESEALAEREGGESEALAERLPAPRTRGSRIVAVTGRLAVWWLAAILVLGACGRPRLSGPVPVEPPSAPPTLVREQPLPTVAAPRPKRSPFEELVLAVEREPALRDMALYLAVRRHARRGHAEAATLTAQTLLADHPESTWATGACLTVGRVRRRTGDLAEARVWLERARALAPPDSRTRLLASYELGRVRRAQGDPRAALALADGVREAAPTSLVARRARRLADRIRERRPGLCGGPAERLAEAERKLAEGDAATANAEVSEVVASGGLDAAVAEEAVWLEARAAHALGEDDRAEQLCLELADHPAGAGGGMLGAPALATAARWRWNADEDDRAERLYHELLQRFPASKEAPQALYALGRIRQEARDYDGAHARYSELATRFPQSPLAFEARWRSGWAHWLAGDDTRAAAELGALASATSGDERVAAEYWEARALERLGDPRSHDRMLHVAERHGETYYGALMRARLGLGPHPVTPEIEPSTPTFPEDLTGPHAERARRLSALGFPGLARRELDALAPDASSATLLEAYAAVGAPGAALGLARRQWPSEDAAQRRYLYPLGFWEVVEEEAWANGLDPLLVSAVIRQESRFRPEAISPANAHGLMQLLPPTACDVARQGGQPEPRTDALRDVRTNVALGTRHLRELLDRYLGSTVRALAAYNAGAEAVAKWDARHGDRPVDEFVELISYEETRDYVKSVLGDYQVYRTLYAPSASTTFAGSPPNAPFDMTTMTSPVCAEPTR
jgi:soluble lytic murein transglycosylase